jgi:hypothetical protein
MTTAKTFVVEHVRRKFAPKNHEAIELVPITITAVNFSGSFGQCVRVTFSTNLAEPQRSFVERAVRAHECHDDVHDIRWSDRKTVVVEVRRNSLCRCSRIDVEKAVRQLAANIPLTFR